MDPRGVSLRIARTLGLRYAKTMSSPIFDTHAAANRYKSAGFTDSQVEALVDVARETTALPDISSLSTKADLDKLALATKTDLDRLALATKTDFTQLDGKIDRVQVELKNAIATSQVQTVSLILAGVAAMVAFSSVLPKLIR